MPITNQSKRIETVTRQLAEIGMDNLRSVKLDLPPAALYEEIIRRGEGIVAAGGPVVVTTGVYTGRSARDKFIVEEPKSKAHIAWGEVNRPFEPEQYLRLRNRMMAFLQGRDVFVQDMLAGADPDYQLRIRVVSLWAWHSLFARCMFIHPNDASLPVRKRDFTVIAAPEFKADPAIDGTRSEAFIILNLAMNEVLIGGTGYAGETKKSIFTVLNYILPKKNVLPMHCSANISKDGKDTAVFFGLSGTGKTTLSTDSRRLMIGDDEHGWSDKGIFNFEGGCYAKVIRLSPDEEPEIYNCTRQFGTVLENVVCDPATRELNLNDERYTENTRAAYPLSSLPNVQTSGLGGHPNHVIMLTADAFGILPPVARLTPDQAMYHFLSGYTAKLAGTERGLKDPQATFSTCFGSPFMIRDPVIYAEMLGRRLKETNAHCWLVNTGWTGGPFGVGYRMPIHDTRTIIQHILDNGLNKVECRMDPIFGLAVPKAIPGVDPERLIPRKTWQDGKAYDEKATHLAGQFAQNFRQFADRVPASVQATNPGQ